MARPYRRHHYVPAFYLAGFTASGSRDDDVHVLDQAGPKQFQLKPDQAAHQRDLYALEAEDEEARVTVEKVFSEVEGETAPIVRRIITEHLLPDGQEMVVLLNFVAIMAARVPAFLATIDTVADTIGKMMLRQIVQDRQAWEENLERIKASGQPVEDVPYEEIRAFLMSEQYQVELHQNHVIHSMLQSADVVLRTLVKRIWSLVVAPGGEANFVCSDWPVSLEWLTQMPAFWSSPGHGMLNTSLMMPLSKDVALVGAFFGESSVSEASVKDVAIINSQTARNARMVFSCEEDFVWYRKNDTIAHVEDLIEEIKQRRQASSEPQTGYELE